MKKLKYIIYSLGMALSLSSCDDFLSFEPSDSVGSESAYSTVSDIETGLNGIYYTLGEYEFYGRNIVALGDIAADNMWMTGSSGHFDQIYKYTINADNADLLDIWEKGYELIDRSALLITAAKEMLKEDLSESNTNILKAALAQAYGLKALAHFTLVNIFGLPYSNENKSQLGIIVVGDEHIEAFQEVSRSTVEQSYAQVLDDIASAKNYISAVDFDAFIMNEAALYALEARVRLFMEDWSGAITAANSAITKSGGKLVMNADDYYSMWSSVNATTEDIFTISKLANDNLSANSLNTLYGSYDGKATSGLLALFGENDMRIALFEGSGDQIIAKKYMGLPTSAATSNIPVFRLPEMYLILAESKAQLNQADAVDDLYQVAQRNPDLAKADIPVSRADLLNFISVERRRELFQEGHRWYDLRRTGEVMTRVGGSYSITDWDASQFVYPIPAQEISASGIEQNTNWASGLPLLD
ncbi:MAG: RagB/SusD family nutrient uptake outer membrane protein [Mangrovibacterium sp.]